jgi:hypothetical protein
MQPADLGTVDTVVNGVYRCKHGGSFRLACDFFCVYVPSGWVPNVNLSNGCGSNSVCVHASDIKHDTHTHTHTHNWDRPTTQMLPVQG